MHASIDAARWVVEQHNIEPGDIEQIKIGVNNFGYKLFGQPADAEITPRTVTDAQFSVAYVVAAVIVDGKVDLDSFTDEAIRRPEILQLLRKVETEIDADIDKESPRYPPIASPGRVVIKTKQGKAYEKVVTFAKGNPKNPMTKEELTAKFYHCASHAAMALPKKNLDRVVEMVDNLEELKDIREITALLVS